MGAPHASNASMLLAMFCPVVYFKVCFPQRVTLTCPENHFRTFSDVSKVDISKKEVVLLLSLARKTLEALGK